VPLRQDGEIFRRFRAPAAASRVLQPVCVVIKALLPRRTIFIVFSLKCRVFTESLA
jgi:hypothetical protein